MSPRRHEEPQFTSYYGRPILKEPTWKAPDIAGYLFLGGLAGASSVIGAGADVTGRAALARSAKVGALGAISLSFAALVHDLGRPARVVNMLRVVKPTSPMSMGSWLLAGYAPLVGTAAAADVTGLPRLGRAAGAGAGLLGSAVASYTAVLLANTAVPAWHESRRELPFVFVGSGAAAAGGLSMLTVPPGEAAPARRAAIGGAVVELAAAEAMQRRVGLVAETFHSGRAGTLMRLARAFTTAGAMGAATAGARSRVVAAASGAALLAGSACTRFGIFEAGRASARDPKYTVVPQRERLRQRVEG